MIAAFKRGDDIHKATASTVLGVKVGEVTSEMRRLAKTLNFGIIYGMGPQRLAETTGVPLAEARDFIRKYFEAYPGIKNYTESILEDARRSGFTRTICGRRRPIPGLNDTNMGLKARAENMAVNAPIQGTAADLIKLAMIQLDRRLARGGYASRLVLQIHDELVLECPATEVAEVREIVRQEMENALDVGTPLKVEVGSGKNWLEAHG